MSKQKNRGRKVPSRSNGGSMPPIPDTTKWQPHAGAADSIQESFLQRCIALEKTIALRAQIEHEMSINNFDSGPGVEDIIREEFRRILPHRYCVRSGVINDSAGKTGGDFDLIVFNDFWFPTIKTGATENSRRYHHPIEGVYAVVEIKKTLDYSTLDDAMRKLVVAHRLHRPRTSSIRSSENRDDDLCLHGLTNPLYSGIIAVDIKEDLDLDDLVERFFRINSTLKRLEVVRSLCVLGKGSVTWAFIDGTESRPAIFMREDLYHPILPAYHKYPDTPSPLYYFFLDLMLHLFQSILAPEDIVAFYGHKTPSVMLPRDHSISLPPDKEWLDRMKKPCDPHDPTKRHH